MPAPPAAEGTISLGMPASSSVRRQLVRSEVELMKRAIWNIQRKLQDFEGRYGKLDRDSLYGQADDMELLEGEGEIETMGRLQRKLKSFEEIIFDYK